MDAKELVERNADAWNSRDQDAYLATFADECEIVAPGFTGKGRQAALDFWTAWIGAFPDNRVIMRVLIAEGERVAEESVFEGTNDGPLVNPDGSRTPPTGRRVSAGYSGIHQVRDGRIASMHFYFDQVDLLVQLGLMPG